MYHLSLLTRTEELAKVNITLRWKVIVFFQVIFPGMVRNSALWSNSPTSSHPSLALFAYSSTTVLNCDYMGELKAQGWRDVLGQ